MDNNVPASPPIQKWGSQGPQGTYKDKIWCFSPWWWHQIQSHA